MSPQAFDHSEKQITRKSRCVLEDVVLKETERFVVNPSKFLPSWSYHIYLKSRTFLPVK